MSQSLKLLFCLHRISNKEFFFHCFLHALLSFWMACCGYRSESKKAEAELMFVSYVQSENIEIVQSESFLGSYPLDLYLKPGLLLLTA